MNRSYPDEMHLPGLAAVMWVAANRHGLDRFLAAHRRTGSASVAVSGTCGTPSEAGTVGETTSTSLTSVTRAAYDPTPPLHDREWEVYGMGRRKGYSEGWTSGYEAAKREMRRRRARKAARARRAKQRAR